MSPRARKATAACVLGAALLVCGGGTAVAFAETPPAGSDTAGTDSAADASVPGAAAVGDGRAKSRRADTAPSEDTPSEDTHSDAAGGDDASEATPAGDDPVPGGTAQVSDLQGDKPWPPCCEGGEDDCGPGWPWLWPVDADGSPEYDGEYGEGRPETLPPTRPMPPMGGAGSPGVLDIVPGVGAGQPTQAPINVPILITSPVGLGPFVAPRIGAAPSTGGTGPGTPAAPRQVPEPSPASVPTQPSPRQLSPETAGSGTTTPASVSRVGYAENLRSAGLPQLAVLALPGLAGILVLTGAGGLLGYRQARAGQGVHPTGIVRFINEK